MTAPRRALLAPEPSRGRASIVSVVVGWFRTSWVSAALLSGLFLAAAGLWPLVGPAPGPPQLPAPPQAPVSAVPSLVPTPAVPTPIALVSSEEPPPAVEPRLVMAALGVNAPLDEVGLRGNEVEIPDDPARVGLYAPGASLGDPAGTVLITGHVSWNSRRGALWNLARSRVGQGVEVTLPGELTSHWQVTAVYSVPRDQDHPELFATDGRHRLVVVTCGGPVVGGHYRDLVVVEAAPA